MSENGLPPHDGGYPPGVTQAKIDRAHEGEEPLWNDLECGGLAAYDCGPPRPPDSRDDLREKARAICLELDLQDPKDEDDIERHLRAVVEAERARIKVDIREALMSEFDKAYHEAVQADIKRLRQFEPRFGVAQIQELERLRAENATLRAAVEAERFRADQRLEQMTDEHAQALRAAVEAERERWNNALPPGTRGGDSPDDFDLGWNAAIAAIRRRT